MSANQAVPVIWAVGSTWHLYPVCPACGFDEFEVCGLYCPACGQMLDWGSGNKEEEK